MVPPAILLIGPTGSGKTPLGGLLEQRGLGGTRCVHFDFGAELRAAAGADGGDACLKPEERRAVAGALDGGALLDDDQFYIAKKILMAFMASHDVGGDTVVVLNGLPRHTGQALGLEPLVRAEVVVTLECTAEVACERIETNAGGDRGVRNDDVVQAVRARLETFQKRTVPLVDHYRRRGIRVIALNVGSRTSAVELFHELAKRFAEPAG